MRETAYYCTVEDKDLQELRRKQMKNVCLS